MDAVYTAIWCGGDVDTTAAMTGALAGAYLGESRLPKIYLEKINDRGEWKHEELIELAVKIYELFGT